MYKFHATILIDGADHPAFATYNPIDDSAIVEFKTGEPITADMVRRMTRPGRGAPFADAKLFLHEFEEHSEFAVPARARKFVRQNANLALESAGWDVENF